MYVIDSLVLVSFNEYVQGFVEELRKNTGNYSLTWDVCNHVRDVIFCEVHVHYALYV